MPEKKSEVHFKYQTVPEGMEYITGNDPFWDNPFHTLPTLRLDPDHSFITRVLMYSNPERDIGMLIYDRFIPGQMSMDRAKRYHEAQLGTTCDQKDLTPGDPIRGNAFFDPLMRKVLLYSSANLEGMPELDDRTKHHFTVGEEDLPYVNDENHFIKLPHGINDVWMWGRLRTEIAELIEDHKRITTNGDFYKGREKHENPALVAKTKLDELLGRN